MALFIDHLGAYDTRFLTDDKLLRLAYFRSQLVDDNDAKSASGTM